MINVWSCCDHCRFPSHLEQGQYRYGPTTGHPLPCRDCKPGEQGRLRVDDPAAAAS